MKSYILEFEVDPKTTLEEYVAIVLRIRRDCGPLLHERAPTHHLLYDFCWSGSIHIYRVYDDCMPDVLAVVTDGIPIKDDRLKFTDSDTGKEFSTEGLRTRVARHGNDMAGLWKEIVGEFGKDVRTHPYAPPGARKHPYIHLLMYTLKQVIANELYTQRYIFRGERMEVNGRRVACWWCGGDLEHHKDEKQVVADWQDYDPEEWESVVTGMLRCKSCDATILISRRGDAEPDEESESAPYDRNRCPVCGGYAIWGSDFNYDEVYGEGEGIVSYLICRRCGAELEYSYREDNDEGKSDERCPGLRTGDR